MPNAIAYLMLAAWPLVTLTLFRRLDRAQALIWSLVAGYLLLPPEPAAFDFPLLPPFNKLMIAHLSLVAALFLLARGRNAGPGQWIARWLPESTLMRFLLGLFILSPIATVLANPEPLVFVRQVIPGLGARDALALTITQGLLLIGFLLARRFLSGPEAPRALLVALMISGLAYSLPMLLEIRLSPQINMWVYGFYQHDFRQTLRGGGFRPLVFLPHGLWAAFFLLSSLIAAIGLWRAADEATRPRLLLAVVWLGTVLVLAKSLGALIFATALVPLLLLTGARTQLHVAAMLGVLALAYPALKAADAVPAQVLLEQAEKIDSERAGSLRFRFVNEDRLFARAGQKPLTGWGSWGRNQIRDEVTGEITSISDGRWIIVLGEFGWPGFLAEFGLLALPLLLLWRETRLLPAEAVPPLLGPLALILGANMVDLLPNATLTPLTWLAAGAVLGQAERLKRRRRREALVRGVLAERHPRTVI